MRGHKEYSGELYGINNMFRLRSQQTSVTEEIVKVSGRANECHGGVREGQWSGQRASRRKSSRSVVGPTSVTEEIVKVSGRADERHGGDHQGQWSGSVVEVLQRRSWQQF